MTSHVTCNWLPKNAKWSMVMVLLINPLLIRKSERTSSYSVPDWSRFLSLLWSIRQPIFWWRWVLRTTLGHRWICLVPKDARGTVGRWGSSPRNPQSCWFEDGARAIELTNTLSLWCRTPCRLPRNNKKHFYNSISIGNYSHLECLLSLCTEFSAA